MAFTRKPAMKVVVFPCPCGTLASVLLLERWSASPRACHVRGCTRFIEKHQLHGLDRRLFFLPLRPRRLHVRALLLAGVQDFFKAKIPFIQLMPERGNLNLDAFFHEPRAELSQRQACFFFDPLPNLCFPISNA